MANSITNGHGRSVLHIDTTNAAISFADLKNTGEPTPIMAHIVDIFWQTATSILIDRGGTAIHTFTGTGHWNLGAAGTDLGGTATADFGITLTGASFAIITIHKSY